MERPQSNTHGIGDRHVTVSAVIRLMLATKIDRSDSDHKKVPVLILQQMVINLWRAEAELPHHDNSRWGPIDATSGVRFTSGLSGAEAASASECPEGRHALGRAPAFAG